MNERDIFIAALHQPNLAERAAFLSRVCGDDRALRERVEALLNEQEQLGSFMEQQAGSVGRTGAFAPGRNGADSVGPTEAVGAVIAGRYKLVEEIGEGGMGTVWMAQQTEPVKRLVAVKLIKLGMDSKQVLARFEAERQALALMEHPNIARVLDAGTTGEPGALATGGGRPFFVMELVKGVPLARYCDQHRLTPRQRLELFIPVCQAIQHAHQKGIIHRDIKPTNVLVCLYDGKPVPKVIDFGIAKAAGQQLTEKTLVTGFGSVVGTLEYMSPEQAELNQLDIDTRSDIYSLGVMLYELLTGSTPLERKRLKEAAMLEVLRLIREEEPPRPSTRLSTTDEMPSVAANRGLEPKKLSGMVRGELDWIVMKALEKDRNRRYETANGFAKDIQRYLADEPVQACPPSVRYRLHKFARRNRTALLIAGMFVVFLVLAATVSTWQAVRATLAERQALVERDRSAASFRMARDAVDQLFTQVSQSPKLKAHAMEKFRKDLLQSAKGFYERFIQEQFDEPGVRHDLGLAHNRLAQINLELGAYGAAENSSTKAIELLGELVQAQPEIADYQRDLAASYVSLGLIYSHTAHWDKAEAAYLQALAIQERQASAYPEAAEYQYALAKTYCASGEDLLHADYREGAAARFQQALYVLSNLPRAYPLITEHQSLMATTQMNLGQLYLARGLYVKAELALREARNAYEKLVQGQPDVLPEQWRSLAKCHAILGTAYQLQAGDEKAESAQRHVLADKAEAALQQALAIFEKLVKEHPGVLEFLYDEGRCCFALGEAAERAGRLDASVSRFDKAIEILDAAIAKGYAAARRTYMDARILRARSLAGLGHHVRAANEAEAVSRLENLNSANVYNLACAFCRALAAADRDAKLTPTERTRLRDSYAERAMDFLCQAIAKGYDPRVLSNDTDLDALRTRPDFQKLLAELEAKIKD